MAGTTGRVATYRVGVGSGRDFKCGSRSAGLCVRASGGLRNITGMIRKKLMGDQ